jgi:hypothetical protein
MNAYPAKIGLQRALHTRANVLVKWLSLAVGALNFFLYSPV